MKSNKVTQSAQYAENPRLAFLNIQQFFWSKDGKLILLLDGNTAVSIHANFLKARMGIPYTPVPRKSNFHATTESQVA